MEDRLIRDPLIDWKMMHQSSINFYAYQSTNPQEGRQEAWLGLVRGLTDIPKK